MPRSRSGTGVFPQGMVVDHYQVQAYIATGGFADIYLATDLRTGRPVALKVLFGELGRNPPHVVLFQREQAFGSRVKHHNVVGTLGGGTSAEGIHYIVTEWVHGTVLEELLRFGPLDVARAVAIAGQLCDGVGAVHAQGIVHRDIKSGNVLLSGKPGSEAVHLFDFGIAWTPEVYEHDVIPSGQWFGTPCYAAPEVVMAKPFDHRADLYGVGVLLYEMLTGCLVHGGSDVAQILRAKLRDPIVLPAVLRPEIPAFLSAAVLWALARDPNNRPQSAAALKYHLSRVGQRDYF